nr:putative GH32 family protein [Macrotrachela quadricornifera]
MKVHLLLLILIKFVYSINLNSISLNTLKLPEDLSQVNLSTLPDNSLFIKWRPTYHFASPNSWMNDPCGPLYNPTTQNYHLYYQVQPGYVQWGNISWGHAKSEDMIFWEDVISWEGYNYIALAPCVGNNQSIKGVFSGSALPVSINGDTENGTITAIYTSVKQLPIIWNGFYSLGSETQSLAVSYDDGVTFQHYDNNPILRSPPIEMNITGWRNPKLKKWPEMDIVLYGSNKGNYYMTISSGIQGVGPRVLLYEAPSNNLTRWTYLGPLLAVNGNYTINELWSGSLGYNFEASNAFSLLEKAADSGDNRTIYTVALLGTEGGNTTLHQSTRWSVWIHGNLTQTSNGNPMMNILTGGVLDWGDTYTLNSFHDPKGDRRIFYGWVMEANNNYGERAFGYNGQFSLPREVFVQIYHNVFDVDGSLVQPGPWTVIPNSDGTYTFKTLGIKPIDEITKLRQNNNVVYIISQTFNQPTSFTSLNVSSSNFELQTSINIFSNTSAGFVFRRSSNGLEYTSLIYDPVSQYLILNRTYSSLVTMFANSTIYAKHALLTTKINNHTTQMELLSLRIFVDNSLVEVYANNRTAIVTHIYPTLSDSIGIEYVVGGQGGSITFGETSFWFDLQNAFPKRLANSSINLVDPTNIISGVSF